MCAADSLFLTSSYPRFEGDAAGLFVAEMAAHYQSLGSVTVMAPEDPAVDPVYLPDGVSVQRFAPRYRRKPGPFYGSGGPENMASYSIAAEAPYAAAAMLAAARRHIDGARRIVAHWLAPAGLVGALLCRSDLPLQIIVHGGALDLLQKYAITRPAACWALSRADDIVCVSPGRESTVQAIIGPDSPARVLPMGVDTHAFSEAQAEPLPSGQPLVLGVGRLVPIKGFDRLIIALAGKDARLWLAGEGPEAGRLRRLARETGVSLKLLGAVAPARVARLMRSAAIVALPSRPVGARVEGTPRVLLEAMAAGCAIAASRSGGIGAVLKNGDTALLDEGDDDELAVNLNRLLSDAALRRVLGANAGSAALAYDWSVIAPKLMSPFMRS